MIVEEYEILIIKHCFTYINNDFHGKSSRASNNNFFKKPYLSEFECIS